MNRIVVLSFLLCTAAVAQMQLLQVTAPGSEKEVPAVLAMGAIPVGENITITLRARNTSQATLVVRTVLLTGAGFSMSGQPSLPHQLAPGFNMDVEIRFSPRDYGSYSANFSVNGVGVTLAGSSTAAATLSTAGGPLSSGSVIDFGLTERGTSASKTFRLANTTSERVQVNAIALSGKQFQVAQSPALPLELPPGAVYDFDAVFAPLTSGVFQGALVIDGRTYRLTGAANEPPFPKPAIVIDLPAPASAQQGKVSVEFGEPSRAIGTGTLRMDFRSSASLASDDEAVRFTRGTTSRSSTFNVTEGVVVPLTDLIFQTGTTAGTIVFTAEVGGWTATASVDIAPQKVHLEKTRATRNGSMLELEITGYDNTRTADSLAFTFYTAKGEIVSPGLIQMSGAADFRRFFENSIGGGAFTLKASFPVAGAIAGISSAEVQLSNAGGAAQSGKILLQ